MSACNVSSWFQVSLCACWFGRQQWFWLCFLSRKCISWSQKGPLKQVLFFWFFFFKPQQKKKLSPKFICFQWWPISTGLSSSTVFKVESKSLHLIYEPRKWSFHGQLLSSSPQSFRERMGHIMVTQRFAVIKAHSHLISMEPWQCRPFLHLHVKYLWSGSKYLWDF